MEHDLNFWKKLVTDMVILLGNDPYMVATAIEGWVKKMTDTEDEKRLLELNDDGSIKDIFISENPYTKKNPLNHRFRIGIFENIIYSDGKHAVWKAGSIEADTADEITEALDLLNIPHNIW